MFISILKITVNGQIIVTMWVKNGHNINLTPKEQ